PQLPNHEGPTPLVPSREWQAVQPRLRARARPRSAGRRVAGPTGAPSPPAQPGNKWTRRPPPSTTAANWRGSFMVDLATFQPGPVPTTPAMIPKVGGLSGRNSKSRKQMVNVGDVLWEPSQEWIENSNLYKYRQWLKATRNIEFDSYQALRRWSLDHLDDFWQSIWDYFKIESSTPPTAVLGRREMPGADWFPGARLNWAQHILRQEKPGTTALMYSSETQPLTALDWSVLGPNVRKLATRLREMGIKPGDRVAAYMANTPEAVTA